jgi:hypothetical protein
MLKNKDDNEDLELHNHARHLQDIMHKVRWGGGCFPFTNPKLGMVIYLSISPILLSKQVLVGA